MESFVQGFLEFHTQHRFSPFILQVIVSNLQFKVRHELGHCPLHFHVDNLIHVCLHECAGDVNNHDIPAFVGIQQAWEHDSLYGNHWGAGFFLLCVHSLLAAIPVSPALDGSSYILF